MIISRRYALTEIITFEFFLRRLNWDYFHLGLTGNTK